MLQSALTESNNINANTILNQKEQTKPLHIAAKHGHLNIIKYLVSNHNADINCENSEFLTPLDVATIHGHLDIAEYLTETCGANIIRSRDTMKLLQQARLSKPPIRNTALSMAWNGGGRLSKDVEQDNYNRNAVHIASYRGHVNWIKQAINTSDQKDLFLATDTRGWNALHYAVQNSEENNEQVVQLLLDYVPTLGTQRDQNGLIPYHVAAAATTTSSSSNIRKYLPKDNNICFWLTQYIMFFFMVILSGWIIPPIMLIASAMSAPFSAVLSKSPMVSRKWILLSTIAFLVVVTFAVCTILFHGTIWAISGLVGCLSLYILFAMYRSMKDISMNLVKHPKYKLEKSIATLNTILSMLYHFFVLSASVTKIAIGELPQDSVFSLSSIIPDVMQWPLSIALLKFQVDFAFELNFFPVLFLMICWYIVASWIYYAVATIEKDSLTRRFPFVTEDFFEKIPFAGLITDFTTNTFFLTIYQKLIEMLICSSASVQSTAVANNSTVVFNSSTTMFNNSTAVTSTSTTVVATMAVHDNVICWGPTHQLYASIALGLLIFLVPTATVIGSQFMESKSDEETVYLFFKSKASSVRWTQSFQLWQIGIDMAIGTATVVFSESSVIRLIIVVLCNLLLALYIHLKSPCQYLWSINHWTKASYIFVVVLSVYTFLNGQGWLQEDIIRYSWMFIWIGMLVVFGLMQCCRGKKVHPGRSEESEV